MKRTEAEQFDDDFIDRNDSDLETGLPRQITPSTRPLSSVSTPGAHSPPSSSEASVGSGRFGGGRSWEEWHKEEGQRALGQSYQRHAEGLRDSDACSDHGLDDFTDESLDLDTVPEASTSGAGMRSGKASGSSGKSDSTDYFSRAIRPSVEGLNTQARIAKRRGSLSGLVANQHKHRAKFMEEMEKGGPTPEVGAMAMDEKCAAWVKSCNRKNICLIVMVVISLVFSVVICIPDSPLLTWLRKEEEEARESAIGGEGWIKNLFASASGPADKTGKAKDDKVNKPRGAFSSLPGAKGPVYPSQNLGYSVTGAQWPQYQAQDEASPPIEQSEPPSVEALNDSNANLVAYNTAFEAEGPGIYIPVEVTRNFMSVWETPTNDDQPMFWKVDKSGGDAIEGILTKCLGMVAASNVGVLDGHGEDTELAVNTFTSTDNYDVRYANIDTTTLEGIKRAQALKAVPSGKIDVVFTPFFFPAQQAFDSEHRARVMALLRHPVDREVSTYFYYQSPEGTQDPLYHPTIRMMSLEQFAMSEFAQENHLVRSLTGDFTGDVTQRHVDTAIEVLRRKVVVGLLEDFDASLVRFLQYFGWWKTVSDSNEIMACHRSIAQTRDRSGIYEQSVAGSAAHEALMKRNWADVFLWEEASRLFQEQEALI